MEVKDFVNGNKWDEDKLEMTVSGEMQEIIINNFEPAKEEMVDKSWWTGSQFGFFTSSLPITSLEQGRRRRNRLNLFGIRDCLIGSHFFYGELLKAECLKMM